MVVMRDINISIMNSFPSFATGIAYDEMPNRNSSILCLCPRTKKPMSSYQITTLGRDAQSRVESISSRLALLRRSSSRGIITGTDSRSVSLALATQLLADKVGDDLDVQRRAVVEVSLVDRGKGIAVRAVSLRTEGDRRTAARAKVESGAAELGQLAGGTADLLGGSVAIVFLRIAIRDAGVDRAGVGGVGTGGVLDGAATLEGGALVAVVVISNCAGCDVV